MNRSKMITEAKTMKRNGDSWKKIANHFSGLGYKTKIGTPMTQFVMRYMCENLSSKLKKKRKEDKTLFDRDLAIEAKVFANVLKNRKDITVIQKVRDIVNSNVNCKKDLILMVLNAN